MVTVVMLVLLLCTHIHMHVRTYVCMYVHTDVCIYIRTWDYVDDVPVVMLVLMLRTHR